jgi:metal-responsive CopG/Arc/MetJ family transcriptional regulator
MADTEKDKVWVNTLVEKDLVADFDKLVGELGTNRAALVRNLIHDAVAEHKHIGKIKLRVFSKQRSN